MFNMCRYPTLERHPMIAQYLQQILGYHAEFKVCLVSKPLVRVVVSNFCELSFADCLRNIMIKHSLNSVFAWYPELSNLVFVLSAPAFGFSRWLRPRFWQFMISYEFNKCLSLLLLQLLLISLLSLLYSERNAGNLCTF